MCFDVFLYGKTHVSYIFHIKKHSVLLPMIETHIERNFSIESLFKWQKHAALLLCSKRKNLIFCFIMVSCYKKIAAY
jgi:hypothetical protein